MTAFYMNIVALLPSCTLCAVVVCMRDIRLFVFLIPSSSDFLIRFSPDFLIRSSPDSILALHLRQTCPCFAAASGTEGLP